MTSIPSKPRIKRCFTYAREFIIEQNIKSFPVDPFEIVKRNGWKIYTSSDIAKRKGCRRSEVLSSGKDAEVLFINDEYVIIYNELKHPNRIRWTIMHEIGHIILGHLRDFEQTRISRGGLTESQYKVLERETDIFTAEVLAPITVMKLINVKKAKEISSVFRISKEAALYREIDYKKYIFNFNYTNYCYFILRNHFREFINTFLHGKHCLKCLHFFIHDSADFCPICGHKRLSKRKGVNAMIYDGYDLDENGRPSICPRCENEQIGSEDEFCKICGIQIVNRCTNIKYDRDGFIEFKCDTPAAGNARYCIKCGEKTTYFVNGLLKPWDEELKNKSASKYQVAVSRVANLPDEINDDDLPF